MGCVAKSSVHALAGTWFDPWPYKGKGLMTFSDNQTIKEFLFQVWNRVHGETQKHCVINRVYKGLFVNFLPKITVSPAHGPYGIYRNEFFEQIQPLKQ